MNQIESFIKYWKDQMVPLKSFDIQFKNYIFKNCKFELDNRVDSNCPEDMALNLKFIANYWVDENKRYNN